MDDGGQRENGRHYKGSHMPWNMMPQQHQMKDQNVMAMNKKIMAIMAERDAAIQERDIAIAERREALSSRDVAILQRDAAINERNNALMERDNAIAALQYRESTLQNGPLGYGLQQRGPKRTHQTHSIEPPSNTRDMHVIDAFPISTAPPEVTAKGKKAKQANETQTNSPTKPRRKPKRVGEDLNRRVGSEGVKSRKSEWDTNLGLNMIPFDESTMPVPVCSCTGIIRPCYKWGNGGWQSSCCTTSLSMYPLPQMANKRHARMGGRKMSGSVFGRLLSRVAAEGHDLSTPLDLKDYWSKHGTNRYIIIK